MTDDKADTRNLHKAKTALRIPEDRAALEAAYIQCDEQLVNAHEAIRDLRAGHEQQRREYERVIASKVSRITDLETQLAQAIEEMELRLAPLDILVAYLDKHWRSGPFEKLTHALRVKAWIKEYESMQRENQLLRATRPEGATSPPPSPGSLAAVAPSSD